MAREVGAVGGGEGHDVHGTAKEGDQVRGEGLLLGIRGVKPVATILQAMREQRLLAAGAGENVVRLLPPLIIGESEIEEAITRLDAALSTLDPVPAEAAAGGAQA